MRALVQRVLKSSVEVEGKLVAEIGQGMLVLLGVQKGDCVKDADYLAQKIANLRIFEDENQKMNLSVQDINGELLVVSQFTLAGDTSRGNRPGFESAEKPQVANELYCYFAKSLQQMNIATQTGIFQADMKVSLINDGPVTFLLEKQTSEAANGK